MWRGVREEFQKLTLVLDEYIDRRYNDWLLSLKELDHGELNSKLESTLMQKVTGSGSDNAVIQIDRRSGKLENNFDKQLLSMFNEVRYWDTFEGMPIPYVAHDIANNQRSD